MKCSTSWRGLTMCCLVALGGLVPAASVASPLVNDASIYNVDWATENLSNWTVTAATGAAAPSIDDDGYLLLDNTGATAGTASVQFKAPLAFSSVTSDQTLIVTTRFAIDQFPSHPTPSFTSTAAKFQFRLNLPPINTSQGQMSFLSETFDPSALNTLNNVSGTTSNITTAPGTFYTWQFQITLVDNPSWPTTPHPEYVQNRGSVTVYRRLNDTDDWTLVGEDMPIGVANSATVQGTAAQLAWHSGLTTQGIVRQDYFQVGHAVPEPAAGVVVLMVGGMSLMRRRQRA